MRAQRKKSAGGGRRAGVLWDRETLIEHIGATLGEQAAVTAKVVIDALDEHGIEAEATQAGSGSLVYLVRTGQGWFPVTRVRASGRLEFPFDNYARSSAFRSEAARRDLARRLHDAGGGLQHGPEKVSGYHSIDLGRLSSERARALAAVIAWMADELRRG